MSSPALPPQSTSVRRPTPMMSLIILGFVFMAGAAWLKIAIQRSEDRVQHLQEQRAAELRDAEEKRVAELRDAEEKRKAELRAQVAGIELRRGVMLAYLGSEMANEAGPYSIFGSALNGFIGSLDDVAPRLSKNIYPPELAEHVTDRIPEKAWHDLKERLKSQARMNGSPQQICNEIRAVGAALTTMARRFGDSACDAKECTPPASAANVEGAIQDISKELAAFSRNWRLFKLKIDEHAEGVSVADYAEMCGWTRHAALMFVWYDVEYLNTRLGYLKIARFIRELREASIYVRYFGERGSADPTSRKALVLYAESIERRAEAIEAIANKDYKGAYNYLVETAEIAHTAAVFCEDV